MAFKMSPGRGSFQKTGRGVPPTLMCGSPMKQVVDATTGKTAKELAQEKLNKQMEQAGKNTGDSKNVRTFEASATAKTPGQKVEKIAKTDAEIKRWKAAKEKAKKEGKPFGEKYKAKEETATVKASDTGKDKPETNKTSEKMYFFSNTNQNFGSNSKAGLSDSNAADITSLRNKNKADTNMSNAALGSAFTTGKNNLYSEVAQTPDEARLQERGILPGDYNPASDKIYANKGSYLNNSTPRRSSEEQLKNALKREKVIDNTVAKRAEITNKAKAEAAKKRAEIEAKKAVATKKSAEIVANKKASQKTAPPAKQMAKKSPSKQMKKKSC